MGTSTDKPPVRLVGVLFFASALLLYLLTLAPSVQPGDGPELTVAARVLGVPHPSGYPLYTAIGRLFTLLPFGSVAARMNLFAAVAGAAAVGLFGAWILRVTGSVPASFLTAAALATSRTFWRESTSAEVYTLSALFLALLLLVLPERKDPRRVLVSAYLWGLALTNHLALAFVLPPFALLMLLKGRPSPRPFLLAKVLFLVGLTPYALLPVRASLGPLWNWGDTASFGNLIAHVAGTKYWGYLAGGGMTGGLAGWAKGLAWELTPAVWIAVPLGLWFLGRERRDLLFLVLAGSVLTLAYTFRYGIHDPEAYFIPVHMLLLVPAAFLLARSGRVAGRAAALLLLAAVVAQGARNRPGDRLLLDEHLANVLATVEENGALVVEGDAETFGLLYATIAEGKRTDLALWNPVLDLLPEGPLFERFGPPPGSRLPGWKGAALAEAVRSGVPIYAAAENDEIRPGGDFRLEPWGILFRYVRGGEDPDGEGRRALWERYRTEAVGEVSPRSGYLARVLAASYPVQESRRALLEGREEEGRALLEKALSIGGDTAPVLNNVALAYERIGETGRARELYERAEEVSSDRLPTLNLARLDREEGRGEEAEERYRAVIEEDPRLRYTALLERGTAALERGEPEEAFALFEEAVRDRPREAGAFVGMGEARVQLGDLDGARFFFRWAEQRRPGMERLGELRIAGRLEEEGEPEEAMAICRKLLESDPGDGEALDLFAALAAAAGRPEEADSLFERALRGAGGQAGIANRYAWFLAEEGRRLDRALSLAREARALDPGDPWFADTEGWVLYRLDRTAEASASLEEALRLGHPGADLRYRLGLALVRSGRRGGGEERLAEALDLDPGSAYAPEARALLAGAEAKVPPPPPRR
ncbi:MAG: DUF2723 domain-containing protein [Candidatus Eisenbacteria bacterium]